MNVLRASQRRCYLCGTLHGRKHSYCAGCFAAYMRKHRPKWADLPAETRRRSLARSYARVYLLRGRLVRQPCAVCGDSPAQMHHRDYDKPLQIDWLCKAHHRAVHATQ